MAILFENATIDGDYNIVNLAANTIGIIQISGTWDSATVIIKGSIDGGEVFLEPVNFTGRFTSNIITSIFFTSGKIRATISNAGAGTDLTGHFQQN